MKDLFIIDQIRSISEALGNIEYDLKEATTSYMERQLDELKDYPGDDNLNLMLGALDFAEMLGLLDFIDYRKYRDSAFDVMIAELEKHAPENVKI